MPSKAILPWHPKMLVIRHPVKTKSGPSQDQVKTKSRVFSRATWNNSKINVDDKTSSKATRVFEQEQQGQGNAHKTRRRDSSKEQSPLIYDLRYHCGLLLSSKRVKAYSLRSTLNRVRKPVELRRIDSCLFCEHQRSSPIRQALSPLTSSLEIFRVESLDLSIWIFWIFVPCSKTREHPFEWCFGFKESCVPDSRSSSRQAYRQH
jgi:hypothetical protein